MGRISKEVRSAWVVRVLHVPRPNDRVGFTLQRVDIWISSGVDNEVRFTPEELDASQGRDFIESRCAGDDQLPLQVISLLNSLESPAPLAYVVRNLRQTKFPPGNSFAHDERVEYDPGHSEDENQAC